LHRQKICVSDELWPIEGYTEYKNPRQAKCGIYYFINYKQQAVKIVLYFATKLQLILPPPTFSYLIEKQAKVPEFDVREGIVNRWNYQP
jgi:hypothetical protein